MWSTVDCLPCPREPAPRCVTDLPTAACMPRLQPLLPLLHPYPTTHHAGASGPCTRPAPALGHTAGAAPGAPSCTRSLGCQGSRPTCPQPLACHAAAMLPHWQTHWQRSPSPSPTARAPVAPPPDRLQPRTCQPPTQLTQPHPPPARQPLERQPAARVSGCCRCSTPAPGSAASPPQPHQHAELPPLHPHWLRCWWCCYRNRYQRQQG